MKLLITGIPGTGKTTIGEYLRTHKGYRHFDMECRDLAPPQYHSALNLFLNAPIDKQVITWGFVPGADDQSVRQIQALGYRMFWFDGDREAALRAFLRRGDVPEVAFHAQIARIDSGNPSQFSPIPFNPFDPAGEFLAKETIASNLLETARRNAR